MCSPPPDPPVRVPPVDRHELARRFRLFAAHEARGSSPLYERLCGDWADDPLLADLYAGADPRQQRPNLLLAALHAAVLAGADHELVRYYPSVGGTRPPDGALAETAAEFARENEEPLRAWMAARHTQTNEVRRSAALLAALNQIRWRGVPALVDVGAAAGLNLLVDRYGYSFGSTARLGPERAVQVDCEMVGRQAPAGLGPVRLTDRVGIDLKPLSVNDPEDVLWLRACVWPEHRQRRVMLDAAISEARKDPPVVVRGDAIDTLAEVVTGLPKDRHVAIFHSATLAYLPAEAREGFVAGVAELARQRAVSWIPMEGVGERYGRLDREHHVPAPVDSVYFLLGLTEWADGRRVDRLLARADPHGGWLQWLDA